MIKWFIILAIVKILVDIICVSMQLKILLLLGVIVEFLICMKIISFFITSTVGLVIAGVIVGILGVINIMIASSRNQKNEE